MNYKKKALVITTIASSKNFILKKFAKIALKKNINFIIIGDKKSPSKFLLKGANYFSLKKQREPTFLPFLKLLIFYFLQLEFLDYYFLPLMILQ